MQKMIQRLWDHGFRKDWFQVRLWRWLGLANVVRRLWADRWGAGTSTWSWSRKDWGERPVDCKRENLIRVRARDALL
jgi:hypothetical protein